MLIAHRGFRTKNGENRIVDFKNALKVCKGVEFDIRMTKDKKIIIFHDHNLKRIANIDKQIRSFTYQEIKELDFFKNNNDWIPALFIEDFIKPLSSFYEVINVEIKPDRYTKEEYELIYQALNLLAEFSSAQIIVSSFGKNDLKFISKLDNKFKKGYLFEQISKIDMNLIKKFDYIHPYIGTIKNYKNVKTIKNINLPMNIWTFKNSDDVKIINQLYDKKLINAYISDVPDLNINL